MNITRGFHATFPTDIDDELTLALKLHEAAVLRWGRWKLPRMLRTDPAAVLGRMAYMRPRDFFGVPCATVRGAPFMPETRATNADILTPSHPEWDEFMERLNAELICPDFDDYYGAKQIVLHDSIETEYWPLCSAQIVSGLGFAIAETLAVFLSFLGDTDEGISKYVESGWHRTKPSKIRPAFDALALPVRCDAAPRGTTAADEKAGL
jgi:hypothetical protein